MKVVKKMSWRCEYATYRFFETILGFLTLAQVYRLGSHLGGLLWYLLPNRRSAVLKNIRIAFANERSLSELNVLAREIFQTTGANMLSAIRTARLEPEELDKIVTLSNFSVLEDALKKEKGIVLLVPHMGNWEILAQLTYLLPDGIVGGTHYRPLNNPYLNDLISRRRKRKGTVLFSKRSSPHTLSSFLRKNGVLGILADQRVNRGGYFAPYFGRYTHCSPLPELLASRTEAEIIVLSLSTIDPGKWEAEFHSVHDRDTPGCMSAMEGATRKSVKDTFWFQDRWLLNERNPYQTGAKPHPKADPNSSEKPYRIAYHEEHPSLPAKARPDLQFIKAPSEVFDEKLTAGEIESLLENFSKESALPLDAVHHPGASASLKKACKRLAIQLFTIPIQ